MVIRPFLEAWISNRASSTGKPVKVGTYTCSRRVLYRLVRVGGGIDFAKGVGPLGVAIAARRDGLDWSGDDWGDTVSNDKSPEGMNLLMYGEVVGCSTGPGRRLEALQEPAVIACRSLAAVCCPQATGH